jgi:hypothetical protein
MGAQTGGLVGQVINCQQAAKLLAVSSSSQYTKKRHFGSESSPEEDS